MDLNDVEAIDFNALGGADSIVVNDLSGTDVREVNLNLAASAGVGDGAADTVTALAISGDDVVFVTGNAAGVSVQGLAAQINIFGSEAANDRLVINLQAGDDVLNGSALAAPFNWRSTAAMATTSSSALRATTCCSVVPATTC